MKTRTLQLFTTLVSFWLLMVISINASATPRTWNKTTGGSWTNGSNWTPSGTPAPTDDLTISSDQSGNITGVKDITLNSLTVSGNCTLLSNDDPNTITITSYFSVSAGKTLSLGHSASGQIVFILNSGATGTINGTVTMGNLSTVYFTNNGTLIMPPAGLINGTGGFTLSSGATLQIGSQNGITSGSTASGNIQSTGTRTFSPGANYIYNGGVTQNTGTGLPTGLTGSLTINDPGYTVTLNNGEVIANGGTVNVQSGTFAAGINLTMSTTSTINSSGGSMTGKPKGAGVYNVIYTGSTRSTGTELSGSGLNNVTVNLTSANYLTVDSSFTINGVLYLESTNPAPGTFSGSLNIASADTLTMGATATTTGIGDVTGYVKRTTFVSGTTYTFGNPYTSVVFSSTPTGLAGIVAKISIGTAATWPSPLPTAILRIYDFKYSGTMDPTVYGTLSLHYQNSELNGITEANLVVWDYHPHDLPLAHVDQHGKTAQDLTNHWVSLANISTSTEFFYTYFGNHLYTLANNTIPYYTWSGGANNTSWTNTGNWSNNQIPTSTSDVIIPSGRSYYPSFPTTSIRSLDIESGAVMNDLGGSTLTITGGSGPEAPSGGSWYNAGTFNAGTSTVIFTNPVASLSGTNNFNNLTINTTSGGLTLSTNTDLLITGALTVSTGTLNAASSPNTIEYTGAGQTVAVLSSGYYNLTLSGSGTVIMPGSALTIAGNFTTSGSISATAGNDITIGGNVTLSSGTFIDGGHTLNIAGNWTNNGGTFTSTGTTNFNGTGAQTIGGSTPTTFYILKVNNTAGVSLLTPNTITTLTIADVTSNSVFNDGGQTISTATTLNLNTGGTYNITAGTFPWVTLNAGTGTVNYSSGGSQTVATKIYNNLTLSNSGKKTFSAATTIGGSLSITGTAVASLAVSTASTANKLFLGGLPTSNGKWGSKTAYTTPDHKNNIYFDSITSNTGIVNVSTGCTVGSWTGDVSTDWNTAANWCDGTVPGASTDVIISSATNHPTIGSAGGYCHNITINGGATLTISSSNSLAVTGNWSNSGTFTANSSIVDFNGTSPQTISGSTTFSTLEINNSNGVTLNNGITVTTLTISNEVSNSVFNDGGFTIATATTLNLNTGTYNITASSFPWGTLNAGTGLVNYSLAGAQNVAAFTYYNLTLSGGGSYTKTFSGAITINGTLNINTSVKADLGTYHSSTNILILGGVPQASGNYGGSSNSCSGTANATFFADVSTGCITVNSCAGVWTGNTSTDWNIAGNWCNGTVPDASTDVVILSGGNQPVIGSAGGLCNNITIGSGASLTVSSSYTLTVYGNWTNNGGIFNYGSGTVYFSGSSGQTIGGSSSTAFYNLELDGSSTITLTSVGTINGSLTLSGATIAPSAGLTIVGNVILSTGSFTGGAYTYNVGGNWTLNSATVDLTGTTINFNGIGAQTIAGSSSTTFSTLKINNNYSTGVTLGSDITVKNLVIGNVTSGSIFNDGGYTITPGLSPSLNLNSGTYNLGSQGSSGTPTTMPNWVSYTVNTGTTVGYVSQNTSAVQAVSSALTYTNLTLSGLGKREFTNNTAISGTLSIGVNVIAFLDNGTNSTAGQLVLGGSPEVAGSWGSTVSSAANTNDVYFSTSYNGIITVSAGATDQWTGNSTTDWNTPGNWTGGVPIGSTDVEIPNVTNQPSIGSSSGVCNNMTIDVGAAVTVTPGNFLTVNGTLTNNAANTGLVLQSGSGGTASLINSTTGVSGTVQRYVTLDGTLRYHYFSSPIFSASTSLIYNISSGPPVYKWDYTNKKWSYSGITTMTPGVGYIVACKGTSQAISFTGQMNEGNVNANISGTSGDYDLVGNPYPAAINANTFLTTNSGSINGTLWLWDDNGSYTSADYASCTAGSGCTEGSGHLKVPSGNVGLGQSFFVQSHGGPTTISFTDAMKSTSNNDFFINNTVTPERVYLNMTDTTSNYNEILIAFTPQATKGFDNLYDGTKLQGNPNMSFYSKITNDTNNYVIQGLPPLLVSDTIQLGFYTGVSGKHTIKLEDLQNFNYNPAIYLYDKYNNITTDLSTDSIYSFSSATGKYNDRFYIIFKQPLPAQANAITGNNYLCQSQKNAVFSVDPIANTDEYEWNYDGNGIKLSVNDNILYMDISDSATSGTLMVRGKNSAGYGDSSNLYLNIKPLPSQPVTINGPTTVCTGEKAVNYTASNTTNTNSYFWSLPSFASGNSNTNSINIDFGTKDTMGTILVNGVNDCGNGLSQSLIIMVNPTPATPAITLDANTSILASSSATGNQWYDENGVITGVTNQTYTPTVTGNYYVIVTTGGCPSDPSNTISYSVNSISPASQPVDYDIYPNPANDKVIVKTNILTNNTTIEIYSIEGHLVLQDLLKNTETEISISTLPKGMYIISIINDSKVEKHQLIKE